jgi:hypothetical protein
MRKKKITRCRTFITMSVNELKCYDELKVTKDNDNFFIFQ